MFQREILAILKKGQNLWTGETMPTKFGFYAFQVNLYLQKSFEPILFFDSHGLYIVQKGNLAKFEGKKWVNSPKLKKPCAPNLAGAYAFHINFYLYEFI